MLKNMYTSIAVLLFLGGILVLISSSLIDERSNALVINNNLKIDSYVSEKVQNVINDLIDPEENTPVNIKLSFVGDTLLASFKGERASMNFQDLLETHDYTFPFINVAPIFKNDDFTIANGENVFTDSYLEESPKDYSPAYWYYSKSKYANVYKASSIEVVSIMNNHTDDYGQQGYLDTMQALTKAGVMYGGEEAVILEKDGIKIGLICSNLFHYFQSDEIVAKIKKIRKEVSYLIVYFHGGTEYLYSPPEEIKTYCHAFIDAGADLVLGAHPHVLQPIETYKNKKIVYSLGSFLFGGTTTLVNRTIIYQVNLKFDLDKKNFKETDEIIPCYLYSSDVGYEKWIPSIIENTTERQQVIDFLNGLRSTPD